MTALANEGDFTWILLKSCVKLNEYMPKTKDQKGKKRWLNAQKTHKSQNWAAFQVTSDELTLFSFPLNCRFLKLTCLYKSDRSEGWEVLACTQGRLPLLTYTWYELAPVEKKSSAVGKICSWKTDGWTDGRAAGSQPSELLSALTELTSEEMAPHERSAIDPAHETTPGTDEMCSGLTNKPGRRYWGISLLKTDYLPSGNGKRAFWPLGEQRLIENALRRAGARSDHWIGETKCCFQREVIDDDFIWSLWCDWLLPCLWRHKDPIRMAFARTDRWGWLNSENVVFFCKNRADIVL